MNVFKDQKDQDFYYAEVADYKPLTKPVSYRNDRGELIEAVSPFYNPQNSVRRIPKELLENISLDGAIKLNFKADAHLIQVLGEQLIASEKVGILELIKNAYDAHASYCRVLVEQIDTLPTLEEGQYEFGQYPGPVIVIEDDGRGHSQEQVERIFDPTPGGGDSESGLDLCVAEQIVRQHAGEIHMESRLGEGSTVTVRLPIVGECGCRRCRGFLR